MRVPVILSVVAFGHIHLWVDASLFMAADFDVPLLAEWAWRSSLAPQSSRRKPDEIVTHSL